MPRARLSVIVMFAAAIAAVGQQPAAAPRRLQGQLVLEHLHSAALEKNLLGDPADRSLYVYLPPSYATGSRRYPVVYFLHGYSGDYRTAQWITPLADQAIASGAAREMILVFPDGGNRLGGGFYADSVTDGNFEQHITGEIVRFIDGKYRTLASSSSRGLAGHSMGGNGALRLAMKHPEIYGAVYGMSACCMIWTEDFSLANPAWNDTLKIRSDAEFKAAPFMARAYLASAAAWSPDPKRPPYFADLPVESSGGALTPVPAVAAEWSAEMPVALVPQYRENLRRLRGIAFDVGRQDQFAHIIHGAKMFDEALTLNGIAHQYEQYEGDHGNHVPERFASTVLPFFSKKLDFGAAASAARRP